MTQLSNYVPGDPTIVINELKERTIFKYTNNFKAIIDDKACWKYKGKINSHGYGIFRERRVHIISFIIYKGIPNKDHIIMHTCDIRNCWNPNHLKEGTQKDNIQDAVNKGRAKLWSANHGNAAKLKEKIKCNYGHPLDGLRGNGKRYCKTCNRLRVAGK